MIRWVKSDAGRAEAGYVFENNDCAVRALALVVGIDYKKAYETLEALGRESGRCTSIKLLEVLLELTDSRMTLKQFIETHPVGSYLVWNRRHGIAVKDGVVYDMGKIDGRFRIIGYGK